MKTAPIQSLTIKKGKIVVNGQKYTYKKLLKELTPKTAKANTQIDSGRGWIIPNHGFYDQGMDNIVNGRTHGGRGFIKII